MKEGKIDGKTNTAATNQGGKYKGSEIYQKVQATKIKL